MFLFLLIFFLYNGLKYRKNQLPSTRSECAQGGQRLETLETVFNHLKGRDWLVLLSECQ